MPATLTGAHTYTVETPVGPTTYQKGAEVREDHLALVPKADRKLFTTEAPASDTDASGDMPAVATPPTASSPKTLK